VIPHAGQTFAFIPQNTALLIEATEGKHEVVVPNDTTREDMHQTLMEQLKTYEEPAVSEAETSIQAVLPDEVPTPEPVSKIHDTTDITPTALFCGDSTVVGGGVTSWGPINTTIAEGARIITSLAHDASGTPFYTLQLPLLPGANETGVCLPKGMIGMALDGRVIESDMQFTTHTEGLIGYALDGFGIFSIHENGEDVTSESLDACHGHAHFVVQGGEVVSMYHYHVTADSPYTLGCFRGTPVGS
jgi:hypothetical protein